MVTWMTSTETSDFGVYERLGEEHPHLIMRGERFSIPVFFGKNRGSVGGDFLCFCPKTRFWG
jgi:hypothetical protein